MASDRQAMLGAAAMTTNHRTAQLRITGNVQGVGYRLWAMAEARARGLTGWVRNRADGSVEALVHGPEASVDSFLDAARRGPSTADVAEVTVDAGEPPAEKGFHIRPSA